MRVIPLTPDIAAPAVRSNGAEDFARTLDDLSATLQRAQRAEDSFASGSGSLENAVYERARADVAVAVATAASGRIVQTVQSLLNMQV